VVKLRGHHLVCLHFFSGEGLDEAFLANYRRLLDRLARGEAVEAAAGADDVCRWCPHLGGESCGWDEAVVRELDRLALEELGGGREMTWPEVEAKVRSFSPRWWEEFCTGCDWAEFCTRPR